MVSVHCQEGEDAGGVGSSVYVGSVRSNVGFGDRCMTVHDEFAKIFVAGKKFIANQKQVFFFLLQ